MSFFKTKTLIVFVFPLLLSCAFVSTQDKAQRSILNHRHSLPVLAEAFSEYSWNSQAEQAYTIYLKAYNDFYLKVDYENAIIAFYDAIQTYGLDARFYVSLAESHARLGEYAQAKNILQLGNASLKGFLNYPGIREYDAEIDRLIQGPAVPVQKPPKGIVGKSVDAVLWIPRKLLAGSKKLWIF